MKSVIYVSSTLDEINYSQRVMETDKTDQQAQKFNRAILRGLVENNIDVEAISFRRTYNKLPSVYPFEGVNYRYIDNSHNLFSHYKCFVESYRLCSELMKNKDITYLLADGLGIFSCWGAIFAAKKYKVKTAAFITDVPGIYNKGIISILNKMTISLFQEYIFLTAAMNDVLNPKNKPFIVMEGIYGGNSEKDDISDIELQDNGRKNILYAGILDEKYGVKNLVDAVIYLNGKVNLHLFGMGDCLDYIKELNSDSVIYHGLRDNAEVVAFEKKMDLLVNPRSKDELFTQYSFPSKTIEYMSTGVPVLMQRLPGMPKEYYEYLYLYDGDSPAELADAIMGCLNDETCTQLGQEAQKFIEDNKNAKEQIAKIWEYINN